MDCFGSHRRCRRLASRCTVALTCSCLVFFSHARAFDDIRGRHLAAPINLRGSPRLDAISLRNCRRGGQGDKLHPAFVTRNIESVSRSALNVRGGGSSTEFRSVELSFQSNTLEADLSGRQYDENTARSFVPTNPGQQCCNVVADNAVRTSNAKVRVEESVWPARTAEEEQQQYRTAVVKTTAAMTCAGGCCAMWRGNCSNRERWHIDFVKLRQSEYWVGRPFAVNRFLPWISAYPFCLFVYLDYVANAVVVLPSLTVQALFGIFLMATRGASTGYEFFAGYLVEQSLSIDNLFVFIMLFDYFHVPLELQDRVLSWGIAGAVILRGIMIAVGVATIQKFKFVILLFAGVLLASSIKLITESIQHEVEERSDENLIMKLVAALFPSTSKEFHGERFFITGKNGKRVATPLLLCLVCVELSDFVFAVDSIPAVLGVSKDPLVVYASNIFAIMALRSLYTIVAKAVTDLVYLRPAVALVLGFVGLKMIAEYFHFHIGTDISLAVVCSLLGAGIGASIWGNPQVAKTSEVQK